ncbi:MAG: DUF362 domain-containing protein [Candidatus Riflebacteria bacterium]|nr:DUF362 domain-containing protein [Candidatus Riflebacteria bacterium]
MNHTGSVLIGWMMAFTIAPWAPVGPASASDQPSKASPSAPAREKGFAGYVYRPLSPSEARAAGLPDTDGVVVKQVLPNTPASKAGLEEGDILRRYDDHVIKSESRIDEVRSLYAAGDRVRVTVVRSGKPLTLTMVLEPMPKQYSEARPRTNVDEALRSPRTRFSLPGLFPGRVVEIHDERASLKGRVSPDVVKEMVVKGITTLTGAGPAKSFSMFFSKDDIVGIKVNPVGAGIISTHLEVVDAIIAWLTDNGLPRKNVVIWDRFDHMLAEAGFVPGRYPGISLEALQTMDPDAQEGKSGNDGRWLRPDGRHASEGNFDPDVYYFADVEGPKDKGYLNQHVFNGKNSYFGKLVTKRLTKIINVPVFKNVGNAVSMATKNLGYGAICNTNRLHGPLFLQVCPEVLAFPCIRDKLVLNITDGITGQYEGGPSPAAQFCWPLNTLFFGTDPFAMDMVGHTLMVEKRKSQGVRVNEHPRFTEYLRYAQKVGLGITDVSRIVVVKKCLVGFVVQGSPLNGQERLASPGKAAFRRSPPVTYTAGNLDTHIDGGAVLFLEYGFDRLTVERFSSGSGEITLETYRLASPESALGIYLMSCGKETVVAGVRARNTGNARQITCLKGRCFVQAMGARGGDTLLPDMVRLLNETLDAIAPESLEDPFVHLPRAGLIRGSERLIRGECGLHSLVTLAERNYLGLGGPVTAITGDYSDRTGATYTRILVDYPDDGAAASTFLALCSSLDPTLTMLGRSDALLTYRSSNGRFGIVSRAGRRIEVRFDLLSRP